MPPSRDRRDRKFRDDTDIDTFWCPESRPILIPILRLSLHRDRYWYWYHENVPGLILIPIFYLIRILPRPSKKCSGLWIDTDTDTETPEIPGSRLILILAALVSVLSIRYWYSRLSLKLTVSTLHFHMSASKNIEISCNTVCNVQTGHVTCITCFSPKILTFDGCFDIWIKVVS